MKILVLILYLLSFKLMAEPNAPAYQPWDDPFEKFNATNTITSQTLVIWKRVDNVIDGCNAESKRLGVAKIPYKMQACSFWTKSTCTIITGKNKTQHSLGHELRHCFQGYWHK